jgi:hypothetical protein
MTLSEEFITDKRGWPPEAVSSAVNDLEKRRDVRKFLYADGSSVYWFCRDDSFLLVDRSLRSVTMKQVLNWMFP